MEFKYTARDQKGKRITAKANAESISILVSQLKGQGFLPLQIKRIDDGKGEKNNSYIFKPRIKLKELVVFTRQLAAAINAGLLLTEALETISGDLENRYFGEILLEIIGYIRSGSSFSKALARYPKIFSSSYIAVIKAGEESGSLNRTLDNLAKYLEDTERMEQKIKSATYYPIFLIGFSIIVVSLIVFFVIPRFKEIFAQFNFKLPLLTRMVTDFSEMAIKTSPYLLLALTLGMLLFKFLMRYPKNRLSFHQNILKIYILGNLLKKAWVARFCRILSILLSGGVGLAVSLPISSEVSHNAYLRQIIEKIKNDVIAGSTLTNAFKSHKIFPGMLTKMIQVGEKSGTLTSMLKHNADYYDQELEATLNALSSLIEPMLIVIIGCIVGVVVIAFYLPIFKVATLIR
ncbi:MAG: hypothetical protein AMJ95_12650 [Omnitrophica WOR_2 bacterium SM23_72]|nr:MAG: hypothetical protein AMJ95_12650 [Omnitrophica WOR_2 bacterium SM23_72]